MLARAPPDDLSRPVVAMSGLVTLWLVLAAGGTVVLHRHLQQLDARRRRSQGDFTIDRYDGQGEFKVAVYDEPGHTCPNCYRTCTSVLQYVARGASRRWYYCGHCAPAFMRPAV